MEKPKQTFWPTQYYYIILVYWDTILKDTHTHTHTHTHFLEYMFSCYLRKKNDSTLNEMEIYFSPI